MKALITASFHPDGLARLRRHMEVEYDDWRAKQAHLLRRTAVRRSASGQSAPTC